MSNTNDAGSVQGSDKDYFFPCEEKTVEDIAEDRN